MPTAPRKPTQEMNAFSRQEKRNGASRRTTASGRATNVKSQRYRERRQRRSEQFLRPCQKTEQHEHHDLGEPGRPHRGRPRPGCARASAGCRRPFRRDKRRGSPSRAATCASAKITSALVATKGACRPCARPRRLSTNTIGAPADDPDDGAEDGFAGERDDDVLPGVIAADQQEFDQHDGEEDRERIVDAGFDFQHRADAGPQPQPLGVDQEEHRRRIGRGHDRADQEGLGPVHAEHVSGKRRGQRRGQQHAERRQHHRRRQHAAEGRKPRAQAAVEQDQRERDGADHIGRAHVVELDPARPALARQHAEEQEHQQQRRPEPHRDQARQDAREHQQRAEQNADADDIERGHGWTYPGVVSVE